MVGDHINSHPPPKDLSLCFNFAGHRLWALILGLSQLHWLPWLIWVFWSPGVLGLSTRFPGGDVSGISFVHFVLLMWFCVCFSSPRDKNILKTKKMSPFGISRQKVYYCVIVYTPKLEFHVLIANRTDKSFLGLKKRKPRRLQALPSSVFILTASWMVCLRTCSKLQLFIKVTQEGQ